MGGAIYVRNGSSDVQAQTEDVVRLVSQYALLNRQPANDRIGPFWGLVGSRASRPLSADIGSYFRPGRRDSLEQSARRFFVRMPPLPQ